jgi:hypothetical protein
VRDERPTRKVKEQQVLGGPEVEVEYISCARCCTYTQRGAATCSNCRGQMDWDKAKK